MSQASCGARNEVVEGLGLVGGGAAKHGDICEGASHRNAAGVV